MCIRDRCEGAYFKERRFLKKHFIRNHDGENPWKCTVCEKFFIRSENLRKHQISVHEGYRPIQCDFCESRFKDRWYLKRHVLSMHYDSSSKSEDFDTENNSEVEKHENDERSIKSTDLNENTVNYG